MKKYLAQFMEQFVDGQILLNDITAKNLVSDLEVKSLHAPKIIRELNKLKKNLDQSLSSISNILSLSIADNINAQSIPSYDQRAILIQELETQTNTLKIDLSESRRRIQQLQLQVDEYKKSRDKTLTHSSMNVPSLPNLSPQSSTYSMNGGNGHRGYPHIMDGNQSDATTLTTKSGRLYTNARHLRHDSHMTQRTAYSEGDAKSQLDDIHEKSPTPPVPQDSLSAGWQKYIDHLEVFCVLFAPHSKTLD